MDVEYASNALANSLFGFWTFSFFVGVQRILTFLLCDFMVGQNGSMCTESPFCIEGEWTKQSYPSQLGNKLQRTRENIECFIQWKGTSDQSICRRPKQHCGAQNFWLLPTSDEANCSQCKTPVKRWLANRSKRLSDQIIKNGIHWSPKRWFHCKGHVQFILMNGPAAKGHLLDDVIGLRVPECFGPPVETWHKSTLQRLQRHAFL